MNPKNPIWREVRLIRQALGVTQLRIAADVGINASVLTRYELGAYRLRTEQVVAIVAYLKKRADEQRAIAYRATALEQVAARVQQ